MKKPLIIYGAGGLGKEVLSLVRALDEWEPLGFVDDTLSTGTIVKGLEVLGRASVLSEMASTVSVVVAIGNPFVKARIVKQIQFPHVEFPVLIHPSVILQDAGAIPLGEGTIISAGSVITTDVSLGAHVLINLNVTIGHDTTIADYTSVMPGVNIAGEVHIGEEVLVGSGANIMNRVRIGDRSKIGMGSVVIKDVAPDVTVVGVPAKTVNRP